MRSDGGTCLGGLCLCARLRYIFLIFQVYFDCIGGNKSCGGGSSCGGGGWLMHVAGKGVASLLCSLPWGATK